MDDQKHAFLGDTQLCGNVLICYLMSCQNHVMDLVNALMCGDSDWPSRTGVIFKALSVSFEISTSILHHAFRWRLMLPS